MRRRRDQTESLYKRKTKESKVKARACTGKKRASHPAEGQRRKEKERAHANAPRCCASDNGGFQEVRIASMARILPLDGGMGEGRRGDRREEGGGIHPHPLSFSFSFSFSFSLCFPFPSLRFIPAFSLSLVSLASVSILEAREERKIYHVRGALLKGVPCFL